MLRWKTIVRVMAVVFDTTAMVGGGGGRNMLSVRQNCMPKAKTHEVHHKESTQIGIISNTQTNHCSIGSYLGNVEGRWLDKRRGQSHAPLGTRKGETKRTVCLRDRHEKGSVWLSHRRRRGSVVVVLHGWLQRWYSCGWMTVQVRVLRKL